MCLLTYLPPGVQPIYECLEESCYNNPDGFGWGIVTPEGIVTDRSMSAEVAINDFMTARLQWPDGPALFHARIATHGTITLDNCHPFLVAGKGDMILAHNGILPIDVQPRKGDFRSDTRILADDHMMYKYAHLDSRRTRRRFERWLGSSSKVLILTTNPRYKQQAYLFNERLGSWDYGSWWSNCSYVRYERTLGKNTYESWEEYVDRWQREQGRKEEESWEEYADRWERERRESSDNQAYSYGYGAGGRQKAIESSHDIDLSFRSLPGVHVTESYCEYCESIGSIRRYDLSCAVCETCIGCSADRWSCRCGQLDSLGSPSDTFDGEVVTPDHC